MILIIQLSKVTKQKYTTSSNLLGDSKNFISQALIETLLMYLNFCLKEMNIVIN